MSGKIGSVADLMEEAKMLGIKEAHEIKEYVEQEEEADSEADRITREERAAEREAKLKMKEMEAV